MRSIFRRKTNNLTDERGSVIAATNQAGTVTAINTYDEYGKPGSGNQGRFQYTGQVWLAEVGLYHYKARVYSPALGRFLQPDPIGYADGMNLYAYVGGDPIGRTDPTGMAGEMLQEIVVVGTRISFGFSIDFSSWGSSGKSLGRPPWDKQFVSLKAPGPDETPAGPEKTSCNQRLLDLANDFANWGKSFDSFGDKALVGAGGVAVAGAAFGATGIGLPAGVTAEAAASALAVGGATSKGVAAVLSIGAQAVAARATGDWSYAGPAIFSGIAGILPFKLGAGAAYFQDKISGTASEMVGFGKIPQKCE